MVRSMNRPGNQPNIIYSSDIQRQKHIQHRSLTKVLYCTSSCLSNITLHSSNENPNGRFIHIWKKNLCTHNHLYPPPVKKWSSPPSLMIPRSNRGIKMRKLCTANNSAESSPIDINIIPDWNQCIHIKNYSTINNCRINRRIKPNLNTKDPNLLIYQPHWMNINCTNHKRKLMNSILRNLLNASTYSSICH